MIKLHRLYPDVQTPIRATKESVGYDLFAYCKSETGRPNKVLLPPGATRAIPTGLVAVPPSGYSIFICSRSGMAARQSIFVTNGPGIIDPDYRGELKVLLYNGGHQSIYIGHGERVGQMILLPFKAFDFQEISLDEIDPTERGSDGFGSTGA